MPSQPISDVGDAIEPPMGWHVVCDRHQWKSSFTDDSMAWHRSVETCVEKARKAMTSSEAAKWTTLTRSKLTESGAKPPRLKRELNPDPARGGAFKRPLVYSARSRRGGPGETAPPRSQVERDNLRRLYAVYWAAGATDRMREVAALLAPAYDKTGERELAALFLKALNALSPPSSDQPIVLPQS